MDAITTPATDRFPFVKREDLDSEGQAIWDKRCKAVNSTGLGGHFNVMMRSPKLCQAVSELEGYFRFDSSHSKHDRESWNSSATRHRLRTCRWPTGS